MGNRVSDCEICQEACPWNFRHLNSPLQTKLTPGFRAQIEKLRDCFYLHKLSKMSREEYAAVFGGLNTGIAYELFRRNVNFARKRPTRGGCAAKSRKNASSHET